APSATGPHHVGDLALVAPEAGRPCGGGRVGTAHSPRLHVAHPTDRSLGSYATRCGAERRPRFTNLSVGEAPIACPLPTPAWSEGLVRSAYLHLLRRAAPRLDAVAHWTGSLQRTGYCATAM